MGDKKRFTVKTIFGDVDVEGTEGDRELMEFGKMVKVSFCSWFPNGKTWSVMVYNRFTCCYYTVAYYDNKDAAYREAYVLEACIKSLLNTED